MLYTINIDQPIQQCGTSLQLLSQEHSCTVNSPLIPKYISYINLRCRAGSSVALIQPACFKCLNCLAILFHLGCCRLELFFSCIPLCCSLFRVFTQCMCWCNHSYERHRRNKRYCETTEACTQRLRARTSQLRQAVRQRGIGLTVGWSVLTRSSQLGKKPCVPASCLGHDAG